MKAIAICSCPRLGYMDFMGFSLVAFANNDVVSHNAFGVYWAQALSQAISMAIAEEFDYIFTTDYDSIFKTENVSELIRLMNDSDADAICSTQIGRFGGLLVSTESGKLDCNEVKQQELVPITQGHFGLTILRVSAIKDLVKPWFKSSPNDNGDWDKGKIDDDIYFWKNFQACGKKLFLAPRVVIGHLELLIKWPDENLNGIYETLTDYHQFGAPVNVWK